MQACFAAKSKPEVQILACHLAQVVKGNMVKKPSYLKKKQIIRDKIAIVDTLKLSTEAYTRFKNSDIRLYIDHTK